MVVEHDPLMIQADHIVEMAQPPETRWPGCPRGAARTISPTGPPLTARYLRGDDRIPCYEDPPVRNGTVLQYRRRSRTQSQEPAGQDPPSHAGLHHRRVGLRQSTLIEETL